VAIRDISERKRMEEALRKSEAMYQMITGHMTDSIWLMDMDLKNHLDQSLRGTEPGLQPRGGPVPAAGKRSSRRNR